ncbi:MAG TPA: redoxin domain-containing protein, partial [Isosphaeraceae bacterium]
MRALRTSMAVACLWGIAPAWAGAQSAYTPSFILEKFRPTQKGVDYDAPTEKAAVDACKVEKVLDAQQKAIGIALRDGQGRLLRRFVDANGKAGMDQWSYYQDGFEVYRDVDLNDDLKVDESRWLNAGGTRAAAVQGGRIVGWKRLSAEEASKVLVQGLLAGDLALLETVLATPDELEAAGLPKGLVEQAASAAANRRAAVEALLKGLTGWDKQTVWLRFDGLMPHVIPADAGPGLKGDLTLYENAVIFAGAANGQGDPTKLAYLQVPELIKLGETWKFVDLPRAVDPVKPAAALAYEGIRSWLFRGESGGARPSDNPALDAALRELAEFDTKSAPQLAGGDKKALAQYHYERIKLLRKVVTVTASPDEQLLHNKEIVDSLAAAYQSGQYPPAVKALEELIKQGDRLASYAAFRKILADYALQAEEGSNLVETQKKWIANLEDFLKAYPKSDEVPDVLFQLASVNEFNAEEAAARKYYTRLATDYAGTEEGKKAAGALRRLDLVGQPIDLKGTGLDGGVVDASKYTGRHLLILFWTTTAEPVRRELPELVRLAEKYRAQGLEIVGVCLNDERDKEAVAAFVKDHDLPWPQILEPGGMDSR